jgi:hypothetical protein
MSHIKNLFFDELAKAVQPVPFLAAPPLPMGLHSTWLEREGVQLLCYFEFEPEEIGSCEPISGMKLEPDYPARVTIVNVYVRDVDIMPLLSFETIDKLEHDLLAERDDEI